MTNPKVFEITIDMDKKCAICGKGGAAFVEGKGGVCLSCHEKRMKRELKKK